MKRLTAILLTITLLFLNGIAMADHYGWVFAIYDLNMAIAIDTSYEKTDEDSLAQISSFEQSGNVKPNLILEVYNPESKSQLFIYNAPDVPYENVDELTQAYAEDLGAIDGATDANGTVWQILSDQEFGGLTCSRILSSFENVNAEYILLLSEDNCAYIIAMLTFNNQKPDSALDGISIYFDAFNFSIEPVDETIDAVG